MTSFSLIESGEQEKGTLIAKDTVTKENVYIGKYKSGDSHLHSKFKPEYSVQRMCVYAKSGAGKTTYCSEIMRSYHRQFPDNDIILISPHKKEDEKAFARQLGYIKQMEIEEKPEQIDCTEEFKDCLVVIDDIRGFKTKEMNQFVYGIARSLIYNCRKYGVSVIISNHEIADGHFNKLMNFEAESVTMFPISSLSWRQISYYCDKYLGFDKAAIDKIKGTKSRWITINTTIPNYVMTEEEIYML